MYKDGYLEISTSINGNGNTWKKIPFDLHYAKHVVIKQSKTNGKFWYEIFVDDEQVLNMENKNARNYQSVDLYTSDPWHAPFTSEYGLVCGMKIDYDGKFLCTCHLQWLTKKLVVWVYFQIEILSS